MNIRIGSRSSNLALKQVEISMEEIGIEDYVIEKIVTKGDKQSKVISKTNFIKDCSWSYGWTIRRHCWDSR